MFIDYEQSKMNTTRELKKKKKRKWEFSQHQVVNVCNQAVLNYKPSSIESKSVNTTA